MNDAIIQIIPWLYNSSITNKPIINMMLCKLLYCYTYIYRIQYIYNKLYIPNLCIIRITLCKINKNKDIDVIHTLYAVYNLKDDFNIPVHGEI